MTEDELNAYGHLRPYGVAEAFQRETETRRAMALSTALWGKTAEDLRRQLLNPFPEIPPGFELDDFQRLLELTIKAHQASRNIPVGMLPAFLSSHWETRCEIIRRAVEYLDQR